MRPDQRTDEDMRQHTDDIVTAGARNQPADRGPEPEARGTERADRGTERPEDQNRPERREMPRQRDGQSTRPGADGETARPAADREAARPGADGETARPKADGEAAPSRLFQPDAVERFRGRWQQIQTGFVDDPRAAVQGANDLLAEVIRALAAAVNEHKQELEGKWREASPDQTEDLRLALRRYRSFTNRLLEV